VFHSVSSFCNAGFTVFNGSNLVEFYNNPLFLFFTALWIILGGIGFISLVNIRETLAKTNGNPVKTYKHISNISRMVINWTLLFLVIGTVGIFFFEKYSGHNVSLVNAFFLSASSRTAGFFTFDLYGLSFMSKLLVILLMIIGGASGSAAGGIHINNITTILYSRFNHHISVNKVKKSKAVIFLTVLWIFILFVVTAIAELNIKVDLLFEIVSAFGTVGLSTIGTENLSALTLIILMLSMFIGKYSVSMLAYVAFYKKRSHNNEAK
jgi:trk system potassium uptake protein TrkH